MAEGLDLSALEELTERIRAVAENNGELGENCMKTMTLEAHESAIKNTPVVTGRLKSGWDEDIQQDRAGNTYTVIIRNNVEYAEYVEHGHAQEKGRFVPGLGDDHKGRRLKKRWVKGLHIAKRAELHCKRIAPQVVRLEVEKYLREKLEV